MQAIAAGKFQLALYQVYFVRKIYRSIKNAMKMRMCYYYLYRWKCASVDNIQPKFKPRARAKGTAVRLLRFAYRRNLQKAFIMFRESCTTTAYIKEVWGDRNPRLVGYTPPPRPKVTTANLIAQVAPGEGEKEHEPLKLDDSTIREFKAALKQRHKIEDAAIRRPNAL